MCFKNVTSGQIEIFAQLGVLSEKLGVRIRFVTIILTQRASRNPYLTQFCFDTRFANFLHNRL